MRFKLHYVQFYDDGGYNAEIEVLYGGKSPERSAVIDALEQKILWPPRGTDFSRFPIVRLNAQAPRWRWWTREKLAEELEGE